MSELDRFSTTSTEVMVGSFVVTFPPVESDTWDAFSAVAARSAAAANATTSAVSEELTALEIATEDSFLAPATESEAAIVNGTLDENIATAAATAAAEATTAAVDLTTLEIATEDSFLAPTTENEVPVEAIASTPSIATENRAPATVAPSLPSAAETPPSPAPVPTPALVPTPPIAAPVAPAPPSTRRGSTALGCLRDVLLVIVSALLGATLALSLLYYANGAIDMGRHEKVLALTSSIDTLQRQNDDLATQIDQNVVAADQLRTGLTNLSAAFDLKSGQLDALQGRAADLQNEAQQMQEQITQTEGRLGALDDSLATVAQENTAIRAEVDAVHAQMADLKQSAGRFQTFVTGLQQLVAAIAAPGLTAASPITPSATVTLTAPITNTAPLTTTIPAGVAPPGDETPLSGPFVTGSPTLDLFPPLQPIPLPAPGQSHLYGLVWVDGNGDGVPNAGEQASPGMQVTLRNSRGVQIRAIDTGADGRYLFADIDPGSYTIALMGQGAEATTQVAVAVATDEAVEVNIARPAP